MLQRFGSGLLASGFVALLLKVVGMSPAALKPVQLLEWQNLPVFALPSEPDPVAEVAMRQSLKDWSTKGPTASQGVWMQSGMTRLANHQGTVALPAASLTKIATTLAALDKWGPAHQFETVVSTTGVVKDGVVQGDLVITGSGDPFFVWEEAIALGNSLNQLGIRRVTGNLVVTGEFYMNYREEPLISGQMLQQALNFSSWSPAIATQHAAMPKGTAKPQVAIAGTVKVATIPLPKKFLILRHRSVSLTQILKEMNIYSNNAMAEMLAKSVGGAKITAQLAANSAGVPLEEIQLVNGSGLGVDNRISPRATSAMLMAVQRFLQPHQLDIADIFPVAGRDKRGTMQARNIPFGSAIKTGTLRDVSALAGVMPTRDRGEVWFAIINRGGDVDGFRRQQDELLGRLSKQWGTSPTVNASTTQAPALLGDPKRNEKISGFQTQL
ncbi:MAG: D-alanyl-D-alanine carboxypeptidase [Symplocastrum torsivum CPER-KK1]|jgi:D-alanyl-D-alanine carboxypeptidase/D-alanyl-D-alanine-endopeptidase (penicillin-binding protein 4)|uniref:D-alanyl-D-alanine carboxypeptidase n=1 Tax=Symplocastrum torsivum CPER-KK1 TaxID=450513 RepID=A0A951PK13_9CYAN|nr:D-alanyl-D-alanine carboxypeptidase [Symplocastrum torsivum CPER-KK1]